MIRTLIVFAVLIAAPLAVMAGVFLLHSKAADGLLVPGVVVVAAAVVAVVPTTGVHPTASFSHERLEADRFMTERMATFVGPGMDVQMSDDGMLARTANPAYVKALEAHTYQYDRMVGRAS